MKGSFANLDYCYPSRKANSGKILLARSNFLKIIGSNSASNYVKNSENNLVVVVVVVVVVFVVVIVDIIITAAAAAVIIIVVLSLFVVSTVSG